MQFSDVEDAFQPLGFATKGVVTRGMTIETRDVQHAELLLAYTIAER